MLVYGECVLIFNQSMKSLSDHRINRCLISMLFSYKYSTLLNIRKSGCW